MKQTIEAKSRSSNREQNNSGGSNCEEDGEKGKLINEDMNGGGGREARHGRARMGGREGEGKERSSRAGEEQETREGLAEGIGLREGLVGLR